MLLGIDTGAPYQASWPIPSDGPRLLRVRATDNAGKQKTELVLITIDRVRPSGSLTAPAAGANLRGSTVALSATASDTAPGSVNTVTFQRSPAGAGTWSDVAVDAAPYGTTLDTTALADGLYDLRVFTTDAAGNAESLRDDPGARRQHASDGLGNRPAGGEPARHRRFDLELGRRRLRRRHGRFPALAGRRRHLDEPGRELGHDRRPTASTTSAS